MEFNWLNFLASLGSTLTKNIYIISQTCRKIWGIGVSIDWHRFPRNFGKQWFFFNFTFSGELCNIEPYIICWERVKDSLSLQESGNEAVKKSE